MYFIKPLFFFAVSCVVVAQLAAFDEADMSGRGLKGGEEVEMLSRRESADVAEAEYLAARDDYIAKRDLIRRHGTKAKGKFAKYGYGRCESNRNGSEA
ncbi:unnamed protein product [Clonostachys rosea f. rosea IK726]|uniref:Uncharacterized protein n=2 Tax=Clonostachys rosea f. rosea IK726 TaxID=1349383 RepID=A0ACA9UDU1_BIOOC|nr:unnamed protein product [Clonostachys rosea f. rosea IK726]CAG9951411.1 unnamed protein product [Clonostachys rosea f. rosea IK726]